MNQTGIIFNSLRARKARLGSRVGENLIPYLYLSSVIALVIGLYITIFLKHGYGYFLVALAVAIIMFTLWVKYDLLALIPQSNEINDRLSIDILSRIKQNSNNPKAIWQEIADHWQARFFVNHLLLHGAIIDHLMTDNPDDLILALNKSVELADKSGSQIIELGHLLAGLLLTNEGAIRAIESAKLNAEDIEAISDWLTRLIKIKKTQTNNSGGVGRDWSFGFTNFLNHFSDNISMDILRHKLNFGWLTESQDVISIETALANNSSAIAIVGPPGIGKTSRVYALAQRLIEGRTNSKLTYHQILELDVSSIISYSSRNSNLESVFRRLINEASHAGHVVIFLDNAELFFNEGTGAINAANILQPVIQNRAAQFILTFTPEDFQRLKMNNPSLASQLTPIILSELPENAVMNILEDSVIGMENHYSCLVSYDAIKTAYQLSDRYSNDEAYPGKAIKLLEQSMNFASSQLVDHTSVERAIEKTHGVKVGAANKIESDTLLHLEDKIHERMINQSDAVSAVASALRRARAGIADPKRPIGSFLFLGPTGVGKTELAKAIAATYFGSDNNLVRLDMSEYQQEQDVSRLLDPGQDNNISFLMSVRRQPFSVILLDEIEKAHPNILNLLLQLIDEGRLTDNMGKAVSFKDAIIIATSNAGANQIRQTISNGSNLQDFKEELTDQLIQDGSFKPELLNRFDDIILFRPLNKDELTQIVQLMMKEVNRTLTNQNISVELTTAAISKIVEEGYDARFGARPMRRILQRSVEDGIAGRILRGETKPGDHVILDESDLSNT